MSGKSFACVLWDPFFGGYNKKTRLRARWALNIPSKPVRIPSFPILTGWFDQTASVQGGAMTSWLAPD